LIIKKCLLLLCILWCSLPLRATDLPYDDKADAHADLRRALAQAQRDDRKVLAVFGANWCPECRRLDKEISENRTAIDTDDFVIVKIDVGNFDRNTDITQAYGNVTKKGIPAAVILTADNRVEFAGRLSHLTSPYKRYLKLAVYAALPAGLVLALAGLTFHLRRRRREPRAAVAPTFR
jgi:thioredoxin 1